MADTNGATTHDVRHEYGGVEPQVINQNLATLAGWMLQITRHWSRGRRAFYALISATFPATTTALSSGVVSLVASQPFILDCSTLPNRIVSLEVWNYDSSNAVELRTITPQGGIITGAGNLQAASGRGISIAKSSYYSTDINLAAMETQVVLDPGSNAISGVQLVVHGL
jgi:hypothetical protein